MASMQDRVARAAPPTRPRDCRRARRIETPRGLHGRHRPVSARTDGRDRISRAAAAEVVARRRREYRRASRVRKGEMLTDLTAATGYSRGHLAELLVRGPRRRGRPVGKPGRKRTYGPDAVGRSRPHGGPADASAPRCCWARSAATCPIRWARRSIPMPAPACSPCPRPRSAAASPCSAGRTAATPPRRAPAGRAARSSRRPKSAPRGASVPSARVSCRPTPSSSGTTAPPRSTSAHSSRSTVSRVSPGSRRWAPTPAVRSPPPSSA